MATVNLGRIKPTWQGTWSSSTSYVADDIVYYNNHAWIAVATNTNSAPADANANWDKMAQGASIPTGATSGQVLTAGASDTYTWETLPPSDDASALTQGTISTDRFPAGSILQVVTTTFDHSSYSTGTNTYYDITGANVTITPKKQSSKFLVTGTFYFTGTLNHSMQARYLRNGSTFGLPSDGSRMPGHGGEEFTPSDGSNGFTMNAIDTPNTTSALTYKAQFATEGSGTHHVGTSSNSYGNVGAAGYPGTYRMVMSVTEIAQ
jgi:hypothetical protein